jgi:hypothetical protein
MADIASRVDIERVDESDATGRGRRPFRLLCGVVSCLFAGLLVYSQTAACAWDESYHLLAAQLIKAGKRPYLDFVFPQTALNTYGNALWMLIFGESWRVIHVVAASFTAGAILLTADYVLARLPLAGWRLPAALATAFTVALNAMVFQFGAVGQAYGICLLAIVAAFRLAIRAVEERGALWASLAGLAAGAAAASSLLTAPVGPVLLIWMFFQNRIGSRWTKCAAFLAGVAIPFLPILRLFLLGPRQVRFSIIEYQLLHRQVDWPGAIRHNFELMISWIDRSQPLFLGLLAAAGLLFIARRSEWDRKLRAELYLCGWLALALAVHISNARPTFAQYYLFAVPFLGILASIGLYDVSSRLYHSDRPWGPVIALAVLLALGLGKSLYERREDMVWADLEEIARQVQQVTPPQNKLLADEAVYFLTRRTPPSGMELNDSHKLNALPADLTALLHVVPRTELNRRITAGEFSTVETCDDDDEKIEALHLPQLYSQRAELSGCAVYWGWAPGHAGAAPAAK